MDTYFNLYCLRIHLHTITNTTNTIIFYWLYFGALINYYQNNKIASYDNKLVMHHMLNL